MRSSRIALPLVLMGLGTAALALPKYMQDFHSTYGIKPGSSLAKSGCMVCHTSASGGKLNPYGMALQKAMKEEKAKGLTGSVLKKVEGLDSDKDGASNIKEIRAGSLPGDPKSKPGKTGVKPGKTGTKAHTMKMPAHGKK